jgi:hypothetical protein
MRKHAEQGSLGIMTSELMWPEAGPDIELVRQQMALQPPDGPVQLEHDGARVTKVKWMSGGTLCSVSASLTTKAPGT